MATINMKPTPTLILVATMLLHMALLEALMIGFSDRSKRNVSQPPEMTIEAQLFQAAAERSAPLPERRPEKSHETPVVETEATAVAVETKSSSAQQQPVSEPVPNSGPTVNASYLATESAKWYPPLSKKYGEEGTVVLRAFILETGHCEKVEIKKSSNYQLLDDAAVALARSLTYRPAIVGGSPVSEWFDFPVVFKLSKH